VAYRALVGLGAELGHGLARVDGIQRDAVKARDGLDELRRNRHLVVVLIVLLVVAFHGITGEGDHLHIEQGRQNRSRCAREKFDRYEGKGYSEWRA
jgi:hypothetical protein